jgi:NADP-reducing hydrogenase subunit HndB
MKKIRSLADLHKIRDEIWTQIKHNETSLQEQPVEIKVGMSTCGIASGAGEIMNCMREECEFQAIDAVIKQTGCLGYCYAEPMVEVKLPGAKSKIFGYVDKNRAKEIIERYIIRGEEVDGQIEVSFQSANN